jgi:hypothetical protein
MHLSPKPKRGVVLEATADQRTSDQTHRLDDSKVGSLSLGKQSTSKSVRTSGIVATSHVEQSCSAIECEAVRKRRAPRNALPCALCLPVTQCPTLCTKGFLPLLREPPLLVGHPVLRVVHKGVVGGPLGVHKKAAHLVAMCMSNVRFGSGAGLSTRPLLFDAHVHVHRTPPWKPRPSSNLHRTKTHHMMH